jgi:hypothetical protein
MRAAHILLVEDNEGDILLTIDAIYKIEQFWLGLATYVN